MWTFGLRDGRCDRVKRRMKQIRGDADRDARDGLRVEVWWSVGLLAFVLGYVGVLATLGGTLQSP